MRILLYLFDLVVALVAGRILGAVVQRVMGRSRAQPFGPGQAAQPPPRQTRGGQMVRDPVCGMFVSTELSQRFTLDGQTFHFCSRECLERYRKESHA
jgi:YHS domain-containing protein